MIKRTKDIFQPEINPSSGKRVLTDIVVAPKKEIATQFFREPTPSIQPSRSQIVKQKRKISKIWAITGCLVLIFLAWGFVSAKMEITLSTKIDSVVLDKAINLSKTPQGDALTFKTFSLADSQAGLFKATENLSKDTKAAGTVVIFNKGKDAQVLIASTRLSSPQGKIYRIPKTIVVPSASLENNKSVPGSKEVAVEADQPGADYNLGLTDFTLPGLKDSPKYDLIFARSKTPIQGGVSGNQLVVGKSDINEALAELTSGARTQAPDIISKKIPPGEFLLTPSIGYAILSQNTNPAAGEAANNFNLKINGEMRGVLVNRESLEAALLKNIPEASMFGSSKVRIKNLDKLGIKLNNYKFDAVSFSMNISGKAELGAELDKDMVKKIIMEKNLPDASSILSIFPEVSRAEVRFKPFWMKVFYSNPPQNPSRIDIILQGN